MIFLFPISLCGGVWGFRLADVGGGDTSELSGGRRQLRPRQQSPVRHKLSSTRLSATKIVNVNIYGDNQTAQSDLTQGKLQAVTVVPTTFSDSIAAYNAAPTSPSHWINTTVPLYLDKGTSLPPKQFHQLSSRYYQP